ncbi:predicted acetyltransferase [Oleispira antarctica RB-8]|uniref:Predicted acetyltransferase n=1 Tax=Oleispira antarctica RB-8 TaxID=698738 RepID=R4YLM1_OLEAN|nr:predicted acetyltransferase [Oleispira antarctica RB-8]
MNFYSRFTSNTHIGDNCHFNGMIVRGKGKVIIGNNFHSGKNILFINSYHQYDNANAIPYDTEKMIDKEIIIESNVWLGDRVLVLGGVTIGEGAIIQAGAVVVSDIPKYAIAGGNPATTFKYRCIKGYNKLLAEDKFC